MEKKSWRPKTTVLVKQVYWLHYQLHVMYTDPMCPFQVEFNRDQHHVTTELTVQELEVNQLKNRIPVEKNSVLSQMEREQGSTRIGRV